MKYMMLLLATILMVGCNKVNEDRHGSFSLFETSKGTVYLLNTTSGETKIIYSTQAAPKLAIKGIYDSEDGKTYEYQGAGKLRELSQQEAVEIILKKYTK